MFDGTEMQVTPVVNGSGNNVKNSSTDAIIPRILSGERTVISHGISQYQVGGVSACGLAALNCTRIVLSAEQDGPKGTDLLEFVIKAKTARVRSQAVLAISLQFTYIFPGNYINLCSVVKFLSPRGRGHLQSSPLFKVVEARIFRIWSPQL